MLKLLIVTTKDEKELLVLVLCLKSKEVYNNIIILPYYWYKS